MEKFLEKHPKIYLIIISIMFVMFIYCIGYTLIDIIEPYFVDTKKEQKEIAIKSIQDYQKSCYNDSTFVIYTQEFTLKELESITMFDLSETDKMVSLQNGNKLYISLKFKRKQPTFEGYINFVKIK